MPDRIVESYHQAPSALRFMSRALKRAQPLPAGAGVPRIAVQWSGFRVTPAQMHMFCVATGLADAQTASVLLPHVFGFRLQMALLTHPAYPLPIWTALQIRNRLVRHRRFDLSSAWNLETRVDEHRLVEKGIEVDLVSRLTSATDCHWESRVTFFHRGRFGAPSPGAPAVPSPGLEQAHVVDDFRLPVGGGWDFGKLTGDYNGIHSWSWYARRLGFRNAFLHPQRVTAMCLSRLREPGDEAQLLELWIKGPLYYRANVQLMAVTDEQGDRFGLSLEGDPRVALVGRWRKGVGM